MKLAVWIYATAVLATALLVKYLGWAVGIIIRQREGNFALAPFTDLFVNQSWWIPAVSVPFFVTAFYLSRNSRITADRTFIFAAFATLVVVVMLGWALLVFTVPFIQLR